MTFAYLSLVFLIFLPILCAAYVKFSVKGYDNRSPRDFNERLEGKGKRAYWAQLNSYEVFPPFAAGVIAAHQMNAPQSTLDILAMTFVALRILYVFLYIYDFHVWRSVAWFAGLGITVSLFFIGVKHF